MHNAPATIVQLTAQVQTGSGSICIKKTISKNAYSSQKDFFPLPYNYKPYFLLYFVFELCFETFEKYKREGLVHSNKYSY